MTSSYSPDCMKRSNSTLMKAGYATVVRALLADMGRQGIDRIVWNSRQQRSGRETGRKMMSAKGYTWLSYRCGGTVKRWHISSVSSNPMHY
jgi:hypothetical protein